MAPPEPTEVYTALRGQALALDREALGLDGDHDGALALVMETGYKEAIASLVAVCDGTASLYFSTGGGVIGAGEDPAVAELAREIVSAGRHYGPHFSHDADLPLPALGQVRFYLVNSGIAIGTVATEVELGLGDHPLSPLFEHCHRLLAAIQLHSERAGARGSSRDG